MIVTHLREIQTRFSEKDKQFVNQLQKMYTEQSDIFRRYSRNDVSSTKERDLLVDASNRMGQVMKEHLSEIPQLHVYSFEQPRETHGTVSRMIAKLRNVETHNEEFVYYTQRAFETLFAYGFQESIRSKKNYFVIPTPVTSPTQNYAIHKLPDLDEQIHNTVMCVMLRGALLPSLIMAKEIQEYSSIGYVPNFALFRIKRDERKDASNMEYILHEEHSFYDIEQLHDKDVIIADPMNATAGSIDSVLKFIYERGAKPRSIKMFHIISAIQGALRLIRAHEDLNLQMYTLWMDPALNTQAYILPGLGDAGDRINGVDNDASPRNVMQLIANYGQNILNLYRDQIHKLEERLFGSLSL